MTPFWQPTAVTQIFHFPGQWDYGWGYLLLFFYTWFGEAGAQL